LTPPPPLPSWFGPRASTDDPAVAALLDQVAPARTWQDIGGEFNLNVRLDAAEPLVLRVHRPWATRGRVAGLRRLRERLQRAGIRVAQPVPILGRDLARVGGRWAELEEFVPHVQPNPSQESYLRLFEELGRLHAGLRVAVWAPGRSPWCAAPNSSSTSWAEPGAASSSRSLRSTATTSSATRSNCQMAPG
jgi:Ser/Thr protein kinase RdoA (MazF antagonist)